jgi:hypothetical protein
MTRLTTSRIPHNVNPEGMEVGHGGLPAVFGSHFLVNEVSIFG